MTMAVISGSESTLIHKAVLTKTLTHLLAMMIMLASLSGILILTYTSKEMMLVHTAAAMVVTYVSVNVFLFKSD